MEVKTSDSVLNVKDKIKNVIGVMKEDFILQATWLDDDEESDEAGWNHGPEYSTDLQDDCALVQCGVDGVKRCNLLINKPHELQINIASISGKR